MSHLKCSKEYAVVGCGKSILVYSLRHGGCLMSYDHVFDSSIKDGKNNDVITRIEAVEISNQGRFFCALFSDKICVCWKAENWTEIERIEVKRRSTAVCFDSKDETILIADKSGDVYRYFITEIVDVQKKTTQQEPILGHVSMLLDVKVTCDGRYVLTADRDEKIRVSLVEKPFVIESFCLGHTEFVCSLMPLQLSSHNEHYFISGSGDGAVILWEAKTGKLCGRFCFSEDGAETGQNRFIPSLMASSDRKFAVASLQDNKVFVFSISFADATFNHIYTIPLPLSDCESVSGLSILGDQLLVLGKNASSRLFLTCYTLRDSTFDPGCLKAADVISENVGKLPAMTSQNKYEGLFRTRCDGVVYEAYVRKKQERLRSKQVADAENQESDAKKIKLGEEVQGTI